MLITSSIRYAFLNLRTTQVRIGCLGLCLAMSSPGYVTGQTSQTTHAAYRQELMAQGTPSSPASSIQRQAQTAQKTKKKARWGRPKRRTSGGDRNPGPEACQVPLIAIVPGQGNVSLETDQCGSSSWSKPSMTTLRSPTVWFYVPPLNYSGLTAELTLLQNDEPIHTSQHIIHQTGGLIPIPFQYELEANTWYDWQFSVILDPDHPTEDLMVENSIQYNPSQTSSSIHDDLNQTARSYCLNPTDTGLQQEWASVLQTVDLAGIIAADWITCDSPSVEVSQGLSTSPKKQ